MGSSLACCGKNAEDPNNVTTDFIHSKGDPRIKDKIALIVKI